MKTGFFINHLYLLDERIYISGLFSIWLMDFNKHNTFLFAGKKIKFFWRRIQKSKNTCYWPYCWAFIVFSLEKALVINSKLEIDFNNFSQKLLM